MLLKWTEDQDQQLSRIIRRHGTSDWALIRKYFKSNRSRDSVIKRWHGKLKFEKPPPAETNEKTKRIRNDNKKENTTKRIRVNRKTTGTTTRRDHRMTANTKTQSRSRFQRLRNFVEGTKGERTKKVEHHQEEKAPSSEEQSSSEENVSSEQFDFLWTKSDDDKLLSLVLHQGITGWDRIGNEMGCSQKQAKKRWQSAIYNTIKLDDKVGGFHKYSVQEDSILSIGYRNGLDWKEIMSFLPGTMATLTKTGIGGIAQQKQTLYLPRIPQEDHRKEKRRKDGGRRTAKQRSSTAKSIVIDVQNMQHW